jgi:TonB family protein
MEENKAMNNIIAMKRKSVFVFLGLIFCTPAFTGAQEVRMDVKLRVFEGARQTSRQPVRSVTSSYLQPTVSATIQGDFSLEKQTAQIRKVFNLEDVNLLTEADLYLDIDNPAYMRHYFRLNGHQYTILIRLMEWDVKGQFVIIVNEVADKEEPRNILTTELTLLGGNTAVFGFEDRAGKPYFVSFFISGPRTKLAPPPPPPPPAPPAKVRKRIADFEKDAVKAQGLIKPPKRIKAVPPMYPEKARQEKVEGVVVLNVKVGKNGSVEDTLVLRSPDPLLEEAAIAAVKQWRYEPLVLEGQPRMVVFSVTVRFKLYAGEKDIEEGAVVAGDEISPPKQIKRVDPNYPESARQNGVEGVVILNVRTDEEGRVAQVEVLKSVPELDQAAIDAVKQWRYEPFFSKGKPTPVVFTVTVRFRLQ